MALVSHDPALLTYIFTCHMYRQGWCEAFTFLFLLSFHCKENNDPSSSFHVSMLENNPRRRVHVRCSLKHILFLLFELGTSVGDSYCCSYNEKKLAWRCPCEKRFWKPCFALRMLGQSIKHRITQNRRVQDTPQSLREIIHSPKALKQADETRVQNDT